MVLEDRQDVDLIGVAVVILIVTIVGVAAATGAAGFANTAAVLARSAATTRAVPMSALPHGLPLTG